MSTLIILLAAQPRLAAPTSGGPLAPAEFDYVLSVDGQRVSDRGRASAAALPRAAQVVVVPRPGDVAFQRVAVPKAPAARMRAALVGVMEEGLLEDEDDVHLALGPGAKAGTTDWVAVVNKPWLRAQLAALEAGDVALDRVAPSWWPDEGVAGHTFREGGPDEPAQLAWRVSRIGLIALVAVTLLGLNLRALQEHRAIADKQAALSAMVGATFPDIKVLYDPAAQAQKAIDQLRGAAGRPGDGDIETLLQAAESAWPQGHTPVDSVKYEGGRLTLPGAGWTPQEIERFTIQLRAAGVDVQSASGQLILSHRQPSAAAGRNHS